MADGSSARTSPEGGTNQELLAKKEATRCHRHTDEMSQSAVAVRAPLDHEFDAWAVLFRAYRVFYQLTPDEAIVARVWSWIHDPGHETHALVAIGDDEQMVGLAHYRRFARPSTGSVGTWLDDLFTDPEHRGNGIGRSSSTP